MNTIRIIPRLDIKGPNLVKGIHLEGLRVLGKPEDFARYYYENGADELFFQDVVASLYERNSLKEIITKIAKEIFIPLTVGGGIRTILDIKETLRAGADKVCINTAAIKNPDFIKEASKTFGSSTIMVAIEAIKTLDGKYLSFTDNGREYTGIDVIDWAKRVEELGAGEILITSVDREGTGLGFDIELTRMISEIVNVPVIAHGGATDENNIISVIKEGKADAVAIGSIIHYYALNELILSPNDNEEGNTDFLKSKRNFSKIKTTTINSIKQSLCNSSINIRL